MTKIKYVLISLAGIVVLFIALIAILALILDNKDYQRIVISAVERYTGYQVTIEGDFELNLSTEPSLAASKIHFESIPGGPEPPITQIGQLKIKLAATELFTGTMWIRELLVEDVTFSLMVGQDKRTDKEDTRSKEDKNDIALPIFEHITLRNIILDVSDVDEGHLFQARLNDFTVEDNLSAALQDVKGEGEIDMHDFKIEGQLGSLPHLLLLDDTDPFPIAVNLKSEGAEFKISGEVDDLLEGQGLKLRLAVDMTDLSKFLKIFHVDFPGLGHLKVETDITGDLEAPGASNIDVTISDELNTQFRANGSVKDITNGKGTNIGVSVSSTNNDFIRELLPDILSDFTQLEIKGNLRDYQEDYVIEDIVAYGSNDHGLGVNGVGMLNFGKFATDTLVTQLDLNLQLASPTTEAAKRFLVDLLPEMGPVTGKARLTGPTERLALEDLDINIGESRPLLVKGQGRIAWIPIDDRPISGVDLVLSAKAEQTQLLASAFDITLPELGDVSIKSRLLYSDEQLEFKEIDVRTSHGQGLNVGLSGSLAMNLDESKEDYGNVDVLMTIDAPNFGAAEPLLGARIFSAVGPVKGETKVSGDTRVISLEDLVVSVGQPDDVFLEMRGRIGQSQLFGDHLISDVEIIGSIMADEVSSFASYVDISIPDLGSLKGTWRLVDCKGTYCIDDLEWTIGDPEKFQIKTTGRIDSILRKGSVSMDGVDFDVLATTPSVSAVPFLADSGLPDLGMLQLKAKMTSKGGRIDIGKCTLRAGPEKNPTFSVKGRILGIEDLEKTAIDATFETYAQPWIEKLMKRSMQEKHRLLGTVKVTGLTDHFRIRELKLTTEDAKHLSLRVNGDVKEKKGSFETDIQIDAISEDPSVIGSIFEISMPAFAPVSVNGRLKSKGEKADFYGETHFGGTHFKTIVNHSEALNHKPAIIINNTSDKVYLSDLGIYPEEVKEEEIIHKKKPRFLRGRFFKKGSGEEPDPGEKAKSKPDRLFSQDPLPFDVLKDLNLSLSIDAEKLIGKGFVINNLDFDLVLKDGLLRISPARLSYAEGEVSFESTLDTTGETPEAILKATAEDVDMDALLAHMHRPIMLGGNLNLAVDLRCVGSSLHEMMSSLNGEIGYAVENGKIKRDVEMLTSDAVDVLTALPQIRDYQDLNCMTMRFLFEDGIGKSEILFLDTPNVRTRGVGTLDLGSETMDFILQPKPKKGLPGLSSAIRINGPLNDPKIMTLKFKEAARLTGEILAPYVFLPARAMGYLWYLMKKDKEESPCLYLETE